MMKNFRDLPYNVNVYQNHMKNQNNRTYLKSLDSLHRKISLINVYSMLVINTNDLVWRLGDLARRLCLIRIGQSKGRRFAEMEVVCKLIKGRGGGDL